MKSSSFISFQDVQVLFDSKTTLFNNLSFQINKNSFTVLVGPTGSGKTTILRLIKGIIPYLISYSITGNISINNEFKSEENFFRQSLEVGYLFQDFDLQFVTSSVENELIFSLENTGQSREVIQERLSWFLQKYPFFKTILTRNPHNLSGGELAQVIFISTIIADPEILLLDEPLQNLDFIAKSQFLRIIESYKNKKTIIISSHEIEPFLSIADKFLVINPQTSTIDVYDSKKDFLSNIESYPWINLSPIAIEHFSHEG